MNPIDLLPIEKTIDPSTQEEVAEIVRVSFGGSRPLYIVGGGTSLEQGVRADQPGDALQLGKLDAVIDYPTRDMTITVEAGVTMASLAARLAENNQELPVDAPFADSATIGGVIASNWNGPRRYGLGTIRDYVVGISAIDGRGVAFQGGGRVVKNVAGYDFCKLLTGSFGALGVVTQVTLKLRPIAARRRIVLARCENLELAESIMKGQIDTQVMLAGLEFLSGPGWNWSSETPEQPRPPACIMVAMLEGTDTEVDWMTSRLEEEWCWCGAKNVEVLSPERESQMRDAIVAVSASKKSALTLKANLPPSNVGRFVQTIGDHAQDATLQCHAGNGIVLMSVPNIAESDSPQAICDRVQTFAEELGGCAIVLSCSTNGELNRKAIWGSDAASPMMQSVKRQFDPKNLLNPGRT